MRLPHLLRHSLIMCSLWLASLAPHQASASSHNAVILTVLAVGSDPIELSLEGIDEMAQTTVSTANEFVDGVVDFSGPLARDLVTMAGGNAMSEVILTAANEYSITLDAGDFFTYDVVLATRVDGETLSPRDKGPIWVMYPISDHSELQDSAVNSKLIWQLVQMEVR